VVRRLDSCGLGLFLGHALGDEGVVLDLLLLLVFYPAALERVEVATTLETKGCDQSLDLGRLGIRFRIGLLGALNLPPNNILPNIILLPQIKKAPNLRSPLRPKPLRQNRIRQPGNLTLSLFNDDKGQHSNIGSYDASPDGFALTLAGAAGAVAGVAVGEEEADARG